MLPEGAGPVNQLGLDFYRRLVDRLLEAGVEPLVTLYHWDLPQPLQDAGGWANRDTVKRFVDYAAVVYDALCDRVRWWTTLNEPWCSAYLGHASGVHAPGVADPAAAVASAHHLLLAHGDAVAAMRARDPSNRLGIVLNLTNVHATDDAEVTHDAARRADGLHNRWFLDGVFEGRYPEDVLDDLGPLADAVVHDGDLARVATPTDWLGVNYYQDFGVAARAPGVPVARTPYLGCDGVTAIPLSDERTDMDWSITPAGLTQLLVRAEAEHRHLPPILVTENGAAYDDDAPDADGELVDEARIAYLDRHLRALHAAIVAGVDVRGYCVWSLLDNFEWAHGYGPRFGIVHVDYETQARTPRASARWYSAVARSGVLPAS